MILFYYILGLSARGIQVNLLAQEKPFSSNLPVMNTSIICGLELNEMLVSLHREQFNLKMQKATGQLSKPDQVAKNRKAIARINTVLSEKSSKS